MNEKINIELEKSMAEFLEAQGGSLETVIGKRLNRASRIRRFESGAKSFIICFCAFLLGVGMSDGPSLESSATANRRAPLGAEPMPSGDASTAARATFIASRLNEPDPQTGRTPMYDLIVSGSLEQIRLGLRRGGDPNIPANSYDGPKDSGEWINDANGNTAIQHLAKRGDWSRVMWLLRNHTNIDVAYKNKHGVNLLKIIQVKAAAADSGDEARRATMSEVLEEVQYMTPGDE